MNCLITELIRDMSFDELQEVIDECRFIQTYACGRIAK
jgi:hypothetical protein